PTMAFLDQAVVNSDAESADIEANLRGLVVTNDFSDPSSDLHRGQMPALFQPSNAVTLPPGNGGRVVTHARGINANHQRTGRLDVLVGLARMHDDVSGDEAVKLRRQKCFGRIEGVLSFEI